MADNTNVIDLTALNALTAKADSGLAKTNTRLISEEYNVLLDACKRIGAAVQALQQGGATTKVTITASGTNGTVTPASSTVDKNTSVTLTATANAGYEFSKWSDNNTTNPRTVTATEDKTYTAVFTAKVVGDVNITMSDAGVVSAMTATNANEVLYNLNGGTPTTKYTGGNITLENNNKLVAIGKNTDSGAISVIPIVTVEYNADNASGSNALTITSDYDMTLDGVDKGKSFTMALTVGTYTIVANGRTSTITIEES